MRITLSVVLVSLFAVSCGSKQIDTTIPIDDARLLSSEISSMYVRTATLLEETTAAVRTLDQFAGDIDPASIDIALLRHVLEACFTDSAQMLDGWDPDEVPRRAEASLGPDHAPLTERPPVGRIEACDPARMLALETYLDVVDDGARQFLVDRVLEVDVLRSNLKDVLVVQIDEFERITAAAETELEQLRVIADERRGLAQTSDLPQDERRRVEVDYETMSQELDSVEDVLERVATELGDWRRLRRQLVDEAARNIAALGT